MRVRRRLARIHSVPLSDIQAEAIVADRDYISKVYGASPAIVFQFTHMENDASTRRTISDDGPLIFETSLDACYVARKPRSVKQIAAGRKWAARMNGDGDKIHGYDDGEPCSQNDRPAGYWS